MRRGPVPLQLHAALEPTAAILLIASSWIFNFSSNATAQATRFAVIFGIPELLTALFISWEPADDAWLSSAGGSRVAAAH